MFQGTLRVPERRGLGGPTSNRTEPPPLNHNIQIFNLLFYHQNYKQSAYCAHHGLYIMIMSRLPPGGRLQPPPPCQCMGNGPNQVVKVLVKHIFSKMVSVILACSYHIDVCPSAYVPVRWVLFDAVKTVKTGWNIVIDSWDWLGIRWTCLSGTSLQRIHPLTASAQAVSQYLQDGSSDFWIVGGSERASSICTPSMVHAHK